MRKTSRKTMRSRKVDTHEQIKFLAPKGTAAFLKAEAARQGWNSVTTLFLAQIKIWKEGNSTDGKRPSR